MFQSNFIRIRFLPILKLLQPQTRQRPTMSGNNTHLDLKHIYKCSVQALQPINLINNSVKFQTNNLQIKEKSFLLHHNVYIVGFGKAVLGMAIGLENKIKEHVVAGILSIPYGTKERNSLFNIEIYEGAHQNMPDENSLIAASKIIQLISSLREDDLLIVLISGGGSALLPAPIPPVTLNNKQKVIEQLARRGANIEELNTVRKRLSVLKGGGLAQLAKPAKVVSLILSDVIGDPLTVIASGPTIENTDDPNLPMKIIKKYNLITDMPDSVLQVLSEVKHNYELQNFSHVSNFIIGNNELALQAAAFKAEELGHLPIIMTCKLSGIASDIGKKLVDLAGAILHSDHEKISEICTVLLISDEVRFSLNNIILLAKAKRQKLCLLFGGETTVNVKGDGVGGRNQELALSAAIELNKRQMSNVFLLSAGTDGIDGPTPFAGAIATISVAHEARNKGLSLEKYLNNNDSSTFYTQLENTEWLVNTGHTGTNVMDIIIVLLRIDK